VSGEECHGQIRGRLNVEHYKKLLAQDIENVKRETVRRLLAEAEAELKELETKAKPKRYR
jgi:hypothetical protein